MGWIKAAVSTGTRETSATVHANKKIMSETLALRHSDRKYRFCFSAVLVNFRSCSLSNWRKTRSASAWRPVIHLQKRWVGFIECSHVICSNVFMHESLQRFFLEFSWKNLSISTKNYFGKENYRIKSIMNFLSNIRKLFYSNAWYKITFLHNFKKNGWHKLGHVWLF